MSETAPAFTTEHPSNVENYEYFCLMQTVCRLPLVDVIPVPIILPPPSGGDPPPPPPMAAQAPSRERHQRQWQWQQQRWQQRQQKKMLSQCQLSQNCGAGRGVGGRGDDHYRRLDVACCANEVPHALCGRHIICRHPDGHIIPLAVERPAH